MLTLYNLYVCISNIEKDSGAQRERLRRTAFVQYQNIKTSVGNRLCVTAPAKHDYTFDGCM